MKIAGGGVDVVTDMGDVATEKVAGGDVATENVAGGGASVLTEGWDCG